MFLFLGQILSVEITLKMFHKAPDTRLMSLLWLIRPRMIWSPPAFLASSLVLPTLLSLLLDSMSPPKHEKSYLRTIAKLVPSASQAFFPNFTSFISTYFSELTLNNISSEKMSRPPDPPCFLPTPESTLPFRDPVSIWG